MGDGSGKRDDRRDQSLKVSLVRFAHQDPSKIIAKDDLDEMDVLSTQLAQLNIIVGAGGWLRQAFENALEKGT